MPSTTLREFIGRLFSGRRPSYTTSLLGLDYAGKTTLLYKLKLGEVIQVIPTLGINIEDVAVPTLGDESFHTTCWDIGLGCGGITHMAKLVSLWIENTHAIVWLVDSKDRERLQESVQMLNDILASTNFKNEVPILVLANKQDLPGAIALDEIRLAYASALAGRTFAVFRCSCLEDIEKGGLPEAFYWLRLVLQAPNSPASQLQPHNNDHSKQLLSGRPTADALAEKLDSWVTRALEDPPPDVFIEQFHAINLSSWDHYTHIRIAYILLTQYGRQKGKDMIFQGIERYIRESPQTTGRTFHVTMTYFWVQLVHFGIQSMSKIEPTEPALYSSSASSLDSASTLVESASAIKADLSLHEFARFLVLSPYVVDGNTWSNYYSKDVMMSPAAKAGMVLPDKKPLPNLISRDVV